MPKHLNQKRKIKKQMQTEEQLIAEDKEVKKPKSTSKMYPMDTDPITVKINTVPSLENPSYATHVLRKPSFIEEETRERNMPLLTRDAGKVDGSEASSMTIDDEPANVELYDKIILSVSGYGAQSGDKAADDMSPDMVIKTADGAEKTVRELIPASHKSTVINGMFPSQFEVDVDGQEFVFALGGGREWRVKQEIGGRTMREDGTRSPADYTVYYTFREPTELERKKFRTKAVSATTLRNPKTQEIVERRSTNLGVMRELFDSLIKSIEGATVEGGAINAGNRDHIDKVPATFKKGTIIRLFNFLEADLGN